MSGLPSRKTEERVEKSLRFFFFKLANSAGSRDKGVYRDMDLNWSCVRETCSMQRTEAEWPNGFTVTTGSRVQC